MGSLIIALLSFAYGALYVVFAFKEPPAAIQSFFKVPSIFIFLPDRHVLRAGRITLGALFILTPFIIAYRVIFWSH
jgi:hypothetical protein